MHAHQPRGVAVHFWKYAGNCMELSWNTVQVSASPPNKTDTVSVFRVTVSLGRVTKKENLYLKFQSQTLTWKGYANATTQEDISVRKELPQVYNRFHFDRAYWS